MIKLTELLKLVTIATKDTTDNKKPNFINSFAEIFWAKSHVS